MDLTVVLVGPTGDGKSATGNTILGREAFKSRAHSSTVTKTCELQTTVLEDGQTINVIDTPGFLNKQSELLGGEVKKCIRLARNGIHAFLFVVSFEQRISTEDGTDAVGKLQRIFGENIINNMITVSTHGDAQTYHNNWAIIDLCQGGHVLFYNTTKDEKRKSKQVRNLLSQVKTVISNNGGKPFMSQEFELQKQAESTATDATTRLERLLEVQATTMNAIKKETTQIIDVVEASLRDTTTSLNQQMEKATMKADERVQKYPKKETSELIKWISKSYEKQMTQRLESVEQRVFDTATRLEQQLAKAHAAQMRVNEIAQCQISELIQQRVIDAATRLEQLAQAHAAQMRVNEIARCEISELIQQRVLDAATRLEQQLAEAHATQQQMSQRINDEVESMKDVTTRLEQQLAEAEAARLKADESAQVAQKNSDEQILKLKEVLERAESRGSETIPDFESSSFHVYDPSTYLLQCTIK